MSDGRRLEIIPRVLVLEDNTSWRGQISQLREALEKLQSIAQNSKDDPHCDGSVFASAILEITGEALGK